MRNRRAWAPIAAAGLCVSALLLGGCSAENSSGAAPTTGQGTEGADGTGDGQDGVADAPEEATGTPERGEDPIAPEPAPTLVARPDAPAERVQAQAPAAFDEDTPTVTYPDGLTVAITGISHAEIADRGPGAMTGERYTLFEVEVTNDSGRAVEANQVVVALTYGSPARVANPVYVAGQTLDLSGRIEPGASATADYAFAIPTQGLGEVTLSLDIDGAHGLAVFNGQVP